MRANARRMLGLFLFFGPMTTGIQAEGQGGVGNFQYGGCSNNDYSVKSQSLAAAVRVQTPIGFAAEVEGTYLGGTIRSVNAGAPEAIGASVQASSGSARVGWNWLYGGAEIGAGMYTKISTCCTGSGAAGVVTTTDLRAFPSFSGWAGVPRYAYGWVSFLAEPALLPVDPRPPVFLGVGHQDELVDLRAGFGSGVLFRGTVKLHPLFQPGLDLLYYDDRNWHAAISLRFSFDAFGSGTF